ncbi:Uncharacterized protein PBTT_07193 [Plasmodiophora brassicae]|uniref:Uncharacterized protein n=1 Tax=Plasmodiophora brassicae TaxID=37360 RepID=A0A0G4IX73_PLABS|nr:hypothetical protein PBRA_007687 [Plasmodiophora brassicae]SPQ99583.1 unnamed protein product [Plasmodiophora brassicae]
MTAGAPLSAKDFVQLADDRPDSDAGRALDALTKSLASVVNVVDSDAIVLGCGVSNCTAIYDRVPASLARRSKTAWYVGVGGGLVAMAEALKGGVCVDVDVQLHFPPVKETVVFRAAIVTTAAVVYGVVSRVLFKK